MTRWEENGQGLDGRGRGRRLKVKGIDKNEANKFGFRAILGGVQIPREALATPSNCVRSDVSVTV